MKFEVGIGFGILGLLILVLLCANISLAQTSQHANDTIKKGKLLYEDNFSTSKNSIFGGFSDERGSESFENGKYRITLNGMNSWLDYVAGTNSSNIILEVEAAQVSGPNDNAYGVEFRVNESNYYAFMISGDGYYRIGKITNNSWNTGEYNGWSPLTWKKSSAIHTGNATNLISVVCNGSNFSFYVNDIKVEDYHDDSFPNGEIGLVVANDNALGEVTVDYDNLKVWEISNQ